MSGTVTIDGTPVSCGADTNGIVSFYRESGGAPGIGYLDTSGGYHIKTGGQDGVEPGVYRVAISVKKISQPETRDALPKATLLTAAKYARVSESGLNADVKPGRNSIDFALSSKGP